MTPTLWLLLAIIVTLAAVLLSSWALVWLHRAENAPDCRTADRTTIERDTRRLQAQVPDAPPRARVRAGPIDTSHRLQGTQAQVRAQAVTAALRDTGAACRRTNPYRPGSTAQATWQAHYDRVTAEHQHVQTPAPRRLPEPTRQPAA